ncbi:MAG TPA: hypothetical protein VFX30_02650 [bacterium]|nr:hypothetical protein [bacterium]
MRNARSLVGSALLCLGVYLAASLADPPASRAQDTITVEQCRDQLLSGDFIVTDGGKDFRPLNHVPRDLAKTVQEIIDRKASKDFGRSEERFDRAYAATMRKVREGKWAIDETSQIILDDCYFAVHPDADITD